MTTITTSRAGVVTDTLVTLLKAVPALADPARVFDGPSTSTDTMWTQAIFVGFSGDWHATPLGVTSPGSYTAMLINQERPYLGPTTAFEQLEIECVAAIWTGDTNVQAARNLALALWASVQTVLRTDPSIGIDGSTISDIRTGVLEYDFDDGGNIGAAVRFTVAVKTALLTV